MKHFSTLLSFCFLQPFLAVLLSAESQITTPSILANHQLDHVGFVVKDIDATLDHWVELLGLETRPAIIIAAGDSKNPTQYRGEPSDARAKLAFISLDNVKIELIQPIGNDPSHWHEFLATKGEGVHHFGFNIQQLKETQMSVFQNHGYCLAQFGGWETGEYGYMDTHDALGVTIELLEHYQNNH